ncbi:5-formyltetrahydrofolate cyclo-ligase [Bordetella bronchiseptica B20-10725633]|nr:5-formyltetrahydrofolate cyclo-ligase [Bordetella bronchiseptica B20-10725633]
MRGRLFTWLNLACEQAATQGRPLSRVAAFWPMEDEPDLLPLLEQWVESGIAVCLPAVQERDAPLVFRDWTPDSAMRTGAYGIQEPAAGPAVVPDVVLVPTLGYTLDAARLGYGGGYYDRTLAAWQAAGASPTTIGIAWSEGLLPDDYQAAAHDIALDAILTPDGWVPGAPLVASGAAAGHRSAGSRFLLR